MKVLTFKTVSPLFEMERDGSKPFTTRKVDSEDSRFKSLARWKPSSSWAIEIVNPATGESFMRRLIEVDYIIVYPLWRILYLGDLIGE